MSGASAQLSARVAGDNTLLTTPFPSSLIHFILKSQNVARRCGLEQVRYDWNLHNSMKCLIGPELVRVFYACAKLAAIQSNIYSAPILAMNEMACQFYRLTN